MRTLKLADFKDDKEEITKMIMNASGGECAEADKLFEEYKSIGDIVRASNWDAYSSAQANRICYRSPIMQPRCDIWGKIYWDITFFERGSITGDLSSLENTLGADIRRVIVGNDAKVVLRGAVTVFAGSGCDMHVGSCTEIIAGDRNKIWAAHECGITTGDNCEITCDASSCVIDHGKNCKIIAIDIDDGFYDDNSYDDDDNGEYFDFDSYDDEDNEEYFDFDSHDED